jgi:hypothetical protein
MQWFQFSLPLVTHHRYRNSRRKIAASTPNPHQLLDWENLSESMAVNKVWVGKPTPSGGIMLKLTRPSSSVVLS